jgi:hypothetical protein
MNNNEELSIIDGDVHFGLRNCDKPVISFYEARKLDEERSLQIIEGSENIEKFLRDADCFEIRDLSNKPIIVEISGGFVYFKRFFKEGESDEQ